MEREEEKTGRAVRESFVGEGSERKNRFFRLVGCTTAGDPDGGDSPQNGVWDGRISLNRKSSGRATRTITGCYPLSTHLVSGGRKRSHRSVQEFFHILENPAPHRSPQPPPVVGEVRHLQLRRAGRSWAVCVRQRVLAQHTNTHTHTHEHSPLLLTALAESRGTKRQQQH